MGARRSGGQGNKGGASFTKQGRERIYMGLMVEQKLKLLAKLWLRKGGGNDRERTSCALDKGSVGVASHRKGKKLSLEVV